MIEVCALGLMVAIVDGLLRMFFMRGFYRLRYRCTW